MSDTSEIYSESIFVDSGAHSLYNLEVLKLSKRKGRTGRELAKPKVRWSQGDFSYYDLRPGTPFRKYCDSYAALMKKLKDTDVIWANVDAISNPEKTWEIQQYFEKEHGVSPVPIIHFGTPMEWVDRYVEATAQNKSGGVEQKYELLGVGGLGQGVSRHEYFSWADKFFLHICPESNGRNPLIRTHGFAMTSWELLCRYPWWSVDSATWVKLSAYGWLYIPRWSDTQGWRYDKPPLMINFSTRPSKDKKLDPNDIVADYGEPLVAAGRKVAPREKEANKHINNVVPNVRATALRWLKELGIPMGSTDKKGEMAEFGVTSHHRARSTANLLYLKGLERSRPKWPYPLDHSIVEKQAVDYHKGFGV